MWGSMYVVKGELYGVVRAYVIVCERRMLCVRRSMYGCERRMYGVSEVFYDVERRCICVSEREVCMYCERRNVCV